MYKNVMKDLERYFYSNPKFNSRIPTYNDSSDYTTNAPSYYDDLARKNKLMKVLALRIWEYEEEMIKRLEQWDKNLEDFPDDVKDLLEKWLEDGTLDHIINDTIFNWKADKTYVDSEFLRVDKELNKKADKTYVDSELDKKVNKGELIVNIDDCGAVGNNIKDNADIINSCIRDINVSGGGTLFIPPGDYAVHSEITLLANVDIMGSGRQSKIISKHNGIALNINKEGIILNPEAPALGSGGSVSNFSIIREDQTMTGTGVQLSSFTRGHISQLYIRGFNKGIDTSGSSWSSSIDKCYMHFNVYGIYLYGVDDDGNDPRVTGKTMTRTGFNGGSINRNEIHGNYYGIYFEAHTTIGRYHSHGVWINGNIIESNYIRAIRHTYGTGAVHIQDNYFEFNGLGISNPVGHHVSPQINVQENPDYQLDVRNVQADILLESNATGNIAYNSGKVIIEGNEATASAPVFVAVVNGGHSTIKENRTTGLVAFFFIPLGSNRNPTNHMLIDNNAPLLNADNHYINKPSTVTLNNSGNQHIGYDLNVNGQTVLNRGLVAKGDFSAKGYYWLNKDSVSPAEDLKDIGDEMNYFAVVQNSEGYPTPNGQLSGYKKVAGGYSYSWQIFNRATGDRVYRRYAVSTNEWSEWITLGSQEVYYPSDNRPENLPVYSRIFDTTLRKPIWKVTGGEWVDGNGDPV